MHVAKPVEHWSWDVDRPGLRERGLHAEDEGGQGAEMDQGCENCLYEGQSFPTLFVQTLPHDHYQQGGVREAHEAGVLESLCVDVDRAEES